MPDPILTRVAAGDASAVQECIDRFGGLVWSIVRKRGFPAAEAEDLVQDIFIDIWKSAVRYDAEVASEAAFVAMISRRRLIDRLRAQSRIPTHESPDPQQPAPERPVEITTDRSRLAEAMARLTEGQQRVLQLSFGQGLTYEAIARATGIPHGTVKTHARRGLIRLREHLHAVAAGGPS